MSTYYVSGTVLYCCNLLRPEYKARSMADEMINTLYGQCGHSTTIAVHINRESELYLLLSLRLYSIDLLYGEQSLSKACLHVCIAILAVRNS